MINITKHTKETIKYTKESIEYNRGSSTYFTINKEYVTIRNHKNDIVILDIQHFKQLYENIKKTSLQTIGNKFNIYKPIEDYDGFLVIFYYNPEIEYSTIKFISDEDDNSILVLVDELKKINKVIDYTKQSEYSVDFIDWFEEGQTTIDVNHLTVFEKELAIDYKLRNIHFLKSGYYISIGNFKYILNDLMNLDYYLYSISKLLNKDVENHLLVDIQIERPDISFYYGAEKEKSLYLIIKCNKLFDEVSLSLLQEVIREINRYEQSPST